MKLKLLLITLLSLTLMAGSAVCQPLKVALLLSGPANDGGWNAVAVQGLKDAEAQLGIETAYSEHVTVADSEAAFMDYAAQGFDLVIGHGFQFGEPAVRVGQRFKHVKFAAIEADSHSENAASYRMAIEEVGYLVGILAASMSKTQVIGTVGGMEVPSIVKSIEAYKLGAKSWNPEIRILETYTGSFTDVARGQEAAIAMIDQKADVLTHVANQAGTGVIKAAESRGLLATGDAWDQNVIAPDTVFCSTIYNVPALVVNIVKAVKENRFEGGVFDQGMVDGVVDLSSFHQFEERIPAAARQRVEELKARILDGSFKVPVIEQRSN